MDRCFPTKSMTRYCNVEQGFILSPLPDKTLPVKENLWFFVDNAFVTSKQLLVYFTIIGTSESPRVRLRSSKKLDRILR